MIVTGIVGGSSRVAIVERDGEFYIVGVGDRIGNVTVVAISVDEVVLKQGTRSFTLGLAPVVGSSLTAVGGPPALAVPTVGGAEGASTQQSPPSPAAPQQPSGETSLAQPATPAGPAGNAAPQTSGTAATGATSTSFYSAPASLPVVGSATNQPPQAPSIPGGATVFTPSVFVGTVGTVQYPPTGSSPAASPGGPGATSSSPSSAQTPPPQLPMSAPAQQPAATGSQVAPRVSPPPPPGPTGSATEPSLAGNAQFYQIKAGPVLGRDRAEDIAKRTTQAGVAVGVSVNGQGTIERFRVVSEALVPTAAARRAAALADLHPKQEALPGGQVRLVFGEFGSQGEGTALTARIRARGYAATLVREEGPAYLTIILIPFEKGAVDKSRAIIRSVGTDVPVAVEPVR